MKFQRTQLSAAAIALSALGSLARAQTPVPPPPAPTSAVYDPQQFPAMAGELERFTLSAHGDIDGFILKDGTQVITAPDLSNQIASVLKPGDRVTVHGLHAAALPLVRAVSVTDEATHHTVSDSAMAPAAPPPRPAPPRGIIPPTASALSETAGRVRLVLHGAQGEPNGVLLESGEFLRFPPDQTGQLTALLQPRQQLVAKGIVFSNAVGTVVDVQQLGPTQDRLIAVAAPGAPPPPPPPAS